MDLLEIYLDGTLVHDWVNWDSLEQEITREDTINSFSVQIVSRFTFSGDGYRLILDKLNELGPCAKISAKVVYRPSPSSGTVLFTGVMFLNTLKYKLRESGVECLVTADINDSSFTRSIVGNQDAKFFIGQGIALDGTSYAGAAPIDLTLFNPRDDVNITGTRKAYDAKEVIIDIVRAISDGEIEFSSSWYDALPDDERYCVTTGLNFRGQAQDDPYVSFKEIISELQKKYNLWLFSAQINGVNVLRLEEEDFITQSDEVILTNVADIDVSFDQSKFYSTVNVGSSEYIRDDIGVGYQVADIAQEVPEMSNFPYIPLVTHVEETHNIQADCSVGTSLDLVSMFIIDHNVLFDMIENDNNEYDDQTFLIQYDQTTNRATSEALLGGSGFNRTYQYNGQLINERVVDRWRFQANITNNFVANPDKFNVGTTLTDGPHPDDAEWNPTELDVDSPLPFFNENSRWDTVNYQFVVQETGVYRFDGEIVYNIITNPSGDLGLLAGWIFEFSPDNVFLQKYNLYVGTDNAVGVSSVDFFDRAVYLHKGNTAVFVNRIDWPSPAIGLSWEYLPNSGSLVTRLEIVDTVTTGNFTEEQNENTYFSQRLNFSYPIPADVWLQMVQNPARTVVVQNEVTNGTAVVAKGWPKKIKIDFVKGTARWDLITNIEQKAFVP